MNENENEDEHEEECEYEYGNKDEHEHEDGHENEQEVKRNLDVLMYSMMEPCDDCGAPMRNDCQACGSAQAHARRSISLEYLHKHKD
jgi:hypothetical protein